MESNWGSIVAIILLLVVAAVACGAVFRQKMRLARRRFAGPEKGGGTVATAAEGDATTRRTGSPTDRPAPRP
jgi:hypothetical protein